ncbi:MULTISPECIES: amidohydrolase family protein [Burkholderiaceae]|uniref:amidohydrolase family protein n=1 Tax=Burkholderiaceae TaxID=119060 RepID=UPI001F04BDB3|nr:MULTISPECIES: amidohydrolase family protein [Burkholderiaceae]
MNLQASETMSGSIEGACDCHLHIYDPRFPEQPGNGAPMTGMTVDDYRCVQRKIGTTRAVIVQAKRYGTDNACLVDAIAQFGGAARGIAVVAPDTPLAALRELDACGVRGLRFSVWNARDTVMTVDMLEPLAARIAGLGWHVQLHMSGDQIVEHRDVLNRLPCMIVFDHLARLAPQQGAAHPAFRVVADLLARERCWLKLSGAYLNTLTGAPYEDATRVAEAFVREAPERLVWGSDWPHVTEHGNADTVALRSLLDRWVPDRAMRTRILVDHPAALYGFA